MDSLSVEVERTAVVGGPAKTVASGHPAWRQVPNSDSLLQRQPSMDEERYKETR